MNTQVQRFSGRTAEEAVLNAIDALGEDAEVVDARRIKRPGLAGMLGGEIVVVTARPRGGRAADAAPAPAERTSRRAAKRATKGVARGKDSRAKDTREKDSRAKDTRVRDDSARRFRRSLRAAMDDTGPVGPDDDWYADAAGLADDFADDFANGSADDTVLDLTDRHASAPPAGAAPRRAPRRDIDGVLDLRDHGGPMRPPAASESRLPSRFTEADLAPLPEPPPGVEPQATLSLGPLLAPPPPVPAGIAVAANPAVIDLRSHARQRARNASLAPPPPPPPPQHPLPEQNRSVIDLIGRSGADTVRWSRAELRAIGVPERVLQYLPASDPVSDTIWTMALETAIWWTLRKHRPRTNLVVDGYGPEGAMALLEAVLEGHVIRYLHLGDRSVDATPRELAKAVRSCLPR